MTTTSIIPPITDPLGRHWNQPSREEIAVDEKHAVLSRKTLEKLMNYSHTYPSGTYEGKMWRLVTDDGVNVLCWYVQHADPSKLTVKYREILLLD